MKQYRNWFKNHGVTDLGSHNSLLNSSLGQASIRNMNNSPFLPYEGHDSSRLIRLPTINALDGQGRNFNNTSLGNLDLSKLKDTSKSFSPHKTVFRSQFLDLDSSSRRLTDRRLNNVFTQDLLE